MPPVSKPLRHRGVSERYAAARQGFLEQCYNANAHNSHGVNPRMSYVLIPCQCSLPDKCPRAIRRVIYRAKAGGEHPGATSWFVYSTDGDVDHVQPRSRRPDLRDDPTNMRLCSRFCHRMVKHGGGKGRS